ncbi:hypothetical protein A9G35_03760 [Gilliamella sp. Choc5-1]|uniref:hypothetical protein n=1 Tax=Gilliamella sp. Choc5-1 TaxID=3120238 RepID=UPI00080EC210|nr:hypothetical protein [Gilliamella apicola]OCG47467.1 hypothetical protein A9G35_03760 [Gilliamella apicola]
MTNTKLDDFEKEILRKIDNNEPLTEDEIEELLYYSVDSMVVNTGRWVNDKIEIVQLEHRTFSIEWKQGLTENQESLFASQIPVEVKSVTKIIETTEWVKLEK